VRRWYLGAVGKHLGEHRDLVLVQPLPLRIRCDVPLLIGIQNSSQATILGRIAGLMGGGRGARLTGRADCLPGARGTRGSKGCQRAARRRGASPSGRRRGSTRAWCTAAASAALETGRPHRTPHKRRGRVAGGRHAERRGLRRAGERTSPPPSVGLSLTPQRRGVKYYKLIG
jgi:hypothetical protein